MLNPTMPVSLAAITGFFAKEIENATNNTPDDCLDLPFLDLLVRHTINQSSRTTSRNPWSGSKAERSTTSPAAILLGAIANGTADH